MRNTLGFMCDNFHSDVSGEELTFLSLGRGFWNVVLLVREVTVPVTLLPVPYFVSIPSVVLLPPWLGRDLVTQHCPAYLKLRILCPLAPSQWEKTGLGVFILYGCCKNYNEVGVWAQQIQQGWISEGSKGKPRLHFSQFLEVPDLDLETISHLRGMLCFISSLAILLESFCFTSVFSLFHF